MAGQQMQQTVLGKINFASQKTLKRIVWKNIAEAISLWVVLQTHLPDEYNTVLWQTGRKAEDEQSSQELTTYQS